MDLTKSDAMQGFIRLCGDGFAQGWHERNGGNLTYRMRPEEVAACADAFRRDGEWVPMGVCAPEFGGEYFIATGTGKYFRNVPLAPRDNLCIVEINPAGDARRVVWGLKQGGGPTSEFPTHFMNHAVRARATDGACRVIYHAHPPHLISLTFVLPLTARDFSRALWRSMTECPIVFPDGVGVVDWMVPGGAEIAKATCACMERYEAVVWAHHGLFCAGSDFDSAFGLMHTVEKAAEIYWRVLCTGKPQLATITDDQIRAVTEAFGVQINESLLG